MKVSATDELQIKPGAGIGPIHLQMPRHDVLSILERLGWALESSNGSVDYFCDSSIQVEYGADGTVTFIGVSNGPFVYTFGQVDVFDTPARTLFRLFAEGEPDSHNYCPAEYVFPQQGITVWDADEQYDAKGACSRPVYAQIGLGDRRYVEAVL